MYNGIGLQSARGSATSGHVTKNLSHVKPNFYRDKIAQNRNGSLLSGDDSGDNNKKPNNEILDHKRKREVENKIFEYEESLREDGYTEDEILEKSATYRNKLNRNSKSEMIKTKGSGSDTHEMSYRKTIENKRMKDAFGIRDDFEVKENSRSKRDDDQISHKRSKYTDK